MVENALVFKLNKEVLALRRWTVPLKRDAVGLKGGARRRSICSLIVAWLCAAAPSPVCSVSLFVLFLQRVDQARRSTG